MLWWKAWHICVHEEQNHLFYSPPKKTLQINFVCLPQKWDLGDTRNRQKCSEMLDVLILSTYLLMFSMLSWELYFPYCSTLAKLFSVIYAETFCYRQLTASQWHNHDNVIWKLDRSASCQTHNIYSTRCSQLQEHINAIIVLVADIHISSSQLLAHINAIKMKLRFRGNTHY